MKINDNAYYPLLNDRFSELLQELQDQIMKLGNKLPSDDFINEFIFELSKNQSMQPVTALCRVLSTYDAVSLLNNHPKEYMEIRQTLKDCLNLLKAMHLFMDDGKAVLTELNNVSKCNN